MCWVPDKSAHIANRSLNAYSGVAKQRKAMAPIDRPFQSLISGARFSRGVISINTYKCVEEN